MNDILYLISNLFRIYVLFRFANIFFDRRDVKKSTEIIAYGSYFLINSFVYLNFSLPLLNLITNILLFFLLTFIYEGRISTRLISTILIYSINMSWDAISHFALTQISSNSYDNILAGIISNLLTFATVLILDNAMSIKKKYKLYLIHWLSIFFIPLGSVYVLTIVSLFEIDINNVFIIIVIFILLFINFLVFYLYNFLMRFYEESYEKKMLRQQNNAYINQLKIIKQSQENVRMIRHDMKNHFFILQDMIEKNKKDEALKYLKDILNFVNVSGQYIKSGNEEVDSILNYKIHEAEKYGIKVITDIKIPDKLNILPFDLNVVLGNLLDNAIEAVKNTNNKIIKTKIELDRGILYINTYNSFRGKLIFKDGRPQTTNVDKENHGIGLISVQNVVKKYKGDINIECSDNKFIVDILLYNNINLNA